MLDGKRSFFRAPEIDDALVARCVALDVHPSGPLAGQGGSPATGVALDVEATVMEHESELRALLETQGLEHERRSQRLPVRELTWSVDGDVLTVGFELPRGSFATAVLHEIVRDAWAAAHDSGDAEAG
jgi:tRNA pseudouridine13 synthase